jgi:periplasmic protein TonB
MPDAARVAQAHALDVPIVLRGAKKSADPEKPELFTETARTVLVFDNGAVLHLHSKLVVGQTVYIHNTQNGREVQCKVLEAPGEGELGLTDLEFTTAMPDFWGINLGGDSAAGAAQARATAVDSGAANGDSAEQAKMREPSGRPADDPLAMMLETASKIDVPSMTTPGKESGVPLQEELMSAHEMAPDPSAIPVPMPDFEPAATSAAPGSVPTGEQIDAALKQMSVAATPLTGAEAEGTNDEKHIAALMARDARLAKFAAFKEKQQAEKSQRTAAPGEPAAPATKNAPEPATDAEGAREVKTISSKPSLADQLTTGKNATYVAIGACLLIGVAIFFIWRAMRVPPVPDIVQPESATAQPKTAAPPAAVAPGNAAQPDAPLVRTQPVKSESVELRSSRSREDDGAASGSASSRRRSSPEASGTGIVPAQVLSQPQPTLPPWAVGVQLDGVITLDVTIDESGNMAGAKVISGPRALQREAERAIGLWEFSPAQSDGKPVPSHLRLSVEFLPPPQPKRFP